MMGHKEAEYPPLRLRSFNSPGAPAPFFDRPFVVLFPSNHSLFFLFSLFLPPCCLESRFPTSGFLRIPHILCDLFGFVSGSPVFLVIVLLFLSLHEYLFSIDFPGFSCLSIEFTSRFSPSPVGESPAPPAFNPPHSGAFLLMLMSGDFDEVLVEPLIFPMNLQTYE